MKNNRMKIDGLTQEQCDMLDDMWKADTQEDLVSYFNTLNYDQLQIALTLHAILIQESYEDIIQQDSDIGKNMLRTIGIKLD
mgnify:CR=1 FL=1|tara:strand:+ start:35 stop:280 length:246 start_codon:yes stop_codon:yes gene_type:complete